MNGYCSASAVRAQVFALFVLSLGTACSPDGSRAVSDTQPDVVHLTSRILSEGAFLGRPGKLAATENHVIVIDDAGDPAIHIFDAETGDVVVSLGKDGEGPGEFRSARAVQVVSADPLQFWVYDLGLKRLTLIDLEAAIADPLRPSSNIVLFRDGALPLTPIWAREALYSPGILPNGRLGVFAANGSLERTLGDLPPAPEGTPISVVQHAYAGPLAARPDGAHLVLATRQADRLDVFRTDGGHVMTFRGAGGFDPVYETRVIGGGASMATGDDLRFGYIDVATTQDHIYALFSGRRRGDYPGRATFGQTVHVFDWAGTRIAEYQLDRETLGIAVDPTGRRLYAAPREPAPEIVAYDLPSPTSAIAR